MTFSKVGKLLVFLNFVALVGVMVGIVPVDNLPYIIFSFCCSALLIKD